MRRCGKGERQTWRGIWNEEGKESFKQKIERVKIRESESEEKWVELGERMKEIIKETELKRGEEGRRKEG